MSDHIRHYITMNPTALLMCHSWYLPSEQKQPRGCSNTVLRLHHKTPALVFVFQVSAARTRTWTMKHKNIPLSQFSPGTHLSLSAATHSDTCSHKRTQHINRGISHNFYRAMLINKTKINKRRDWYEHTQRRWPVNGHDGMCLEGCWDNKILRQISVHITTAALKLHFTSEIKKTMASTANFSKETISRWSRWKFWNSNSYIKVADGAEGSSWLVEGWFSRWSNQLSDLIFNGVFVFISSSAIYNYSGA